jgi:glutamate synthase domain-containing protein 3
VDLEPIIETKDADIIRDLVKRHHEFTDSPRAKWILQNWDDMLPRFIKIFPHEYKRVLGVSRAERAYVPGAPTVTMAMAVGQVHHG